ncbi:MAG: SDR family NAD(P)-dependent oxidoreductase [Candidatus Microthrix parvicella]
MPTQPLTGTVALVTGANHGIGAATAIELAERGADIAVSFLRTADQGRTDDYNLARARNAENVIGAIETLGQRAVGIEADLSDPDVPARLFDEAEAALGPVSVLVHNASGWHKDSFSPDRGDAVGRTSVMVNPKSIDSQLHIDARAGALLMAEFITRHRARNARWGRVVTLTSGEGKHFPGEVSYGAGKAALMSYTLSAAAEMADSGVTANVVYPPVTDTGWITDEVRAFVANDFDHHHVAEPSEVAEAIGWLCGEAGRIVTGNVIRLR